MPFVIPRISVPADYNTTAGTRQSDYQSEPTVTDLQKYEAWLREELILTREAIDVMVHGVDDDQAPTATGEPADLTGSSAGLRSS